MLYYLFFQVKSKCESLLKHPIVTGLLNYKWRKFGRYVYYSGLLIFLIYMVLLNVYMAVSPLFYEIDWVQMINNRKNISGLIQIPCIAFDDGMRRLGYWQ